MAQYGMLIGTGLLLIVTAAAFVIAAKAARGVDQFRDEHHIHFTGRGGE